MELVHKRYIKDYKTKCELNGIGFEADLASMCTEIRRCMAVDFPVEFGPEVLTEPTKWLNEMSEEEYEAFKKQRDTEQSQTRKGYDRVKEKIRNKKLQARFPRSSKQGNKKRWWENCAKTFWAVVWNMEWLAHYNVLVLWNWCRFIRNRQKFGNGCWKPWRYLFQSCFFALLKLGRT